MVIKTRLLFYGLDEMYFDQCWLFDFTTCLIILLVTYFGKSFHEGYSFILSSSFFKQVGEETFLACVVKISHKEIDESENTSDYE